MLRDERLGTYADVAVAAGALAPVLDAARALVAGMHPDAVETASARERSIWWGLGPKKMAMGYAWAMPHARHVNFGFFRAAFLPDPERLLEGTGKALRHVKLRTPQDAGNTALRALLATALAERRAALTLGQE